MTDVPEQPTTVDVADIVVPAAVEPAKPDESPAVTETPAPVVEETPQETPAAGTEDQKEAAKPAETEKAPKGPGILAKLIAPFNKKRGPKSPKRKEAETPVEEAPKPEETPATAEAVAEAPNDVTEPVKESETPAVDTPAVVAEPKEEKKEKEKGSSKIKFTRRMSAVVGDYFRKNKSDVPATAKVDEHPPKIDEPTPVAPLENPASESSVPAVTPAEPSEPAKPVEPALAATPVVDAVAS